MPKLFILMKEIFVTSPLIKMQGVSPYYPSYFSHFYSLLHLYQNSNLSAAKLNITNEAQNQEKQLYHTFSTRVLLKYSAGSDLKL